VLAWIVAILLISAVGLYIAAPLSDPAFNSSDFAVDEDWRRNQHEHGLAVQALRELEFDQAMGKLDANDYRALREKLERRALATMQAQPMKSLALESARSEPPAFQAGPTRIANPIPMQLCSDCGARVASAAHFCGNCGARITSARSDSLE
jgi:cytochrome c-type biogenesis protein CcmI